MAGALVGVVVALPDEARSLLDGRPRPGSIVPLGERMLVALSGMGLQRAGSAARELLRRGAGRLACWGTAGGLDPALAAGRLLLPKRVITEDGRSFLVDGAWRWRLEQALHGSHAPSGGVLLTAAEPLCTLDAKRRAFAATHASAVDMESAAVADIAAQAGLPFVVLRAIVDGAGEVLPAAAIAAMDAEGHLHLARLLRGLLARPTDLLSLVILARRFAQARRSLSAAAAVCIEELAAAAPAEPE